MLIVQVGVHCIFQDVRVLRPIHLDDSPPVWCPDCFYSLRYVVLGFVQVCVSGIPQMCSNRDSLGYAVMGIVQECNSGIPSGTVY